MASYRLQFKRSVAKDLRDVPRADLKRILARIESLAEQPRPPGVEKLSEPERYRLRQGDYRIVYEIHDARVLVIVVKVGHRREVYR
jgi:mRNA interferase RelE/StbE